MLGRFYPASEQCYRFCLNLAEVAHQGLWLGLLDRSDLCRVGDGYYSQTLKYQDRAHNLSGFLPWESEVLESHFGGCKGVVVAAAGGGREVVALSRRGIAVTGFDCCRPLVDHARELIASENLNAKMTWSPPDEVPAGLGICDGVIVGWGGYMHIPGRESRIRFLVKLREHVTDGAPILLSFFTRSERSRRLRWTWKIGRCVAALRRRKLPVELGDTIAGTFDHHFTEEELRDELAHGGFRLDLYSSVPYGHAVGIAE